MNFGDLWQEHRKFITALIAGGITLLVVKLILGGVYGGQIERAKRDVDRALADQSRALPAGTDVRKIQADREELEKGFQKLLAATKRKPKDMMQITSAVADPDLHYNAQLDRIRNGVMELAALRNVEVDSKLGLPDAFPSSRAEIEHYLRGLDAVEQLIAVCLEAEQQAEAGIARIERIDIEKAAKAKTGGGARKKPFLSTLRIDASIIGHPQAVDLVLRSFPAPPPEDAAAQGHYLAMLEATVRSLDIGPGAVDRDRKGVDPDDRRRVECRLSLLCLDIDPDGQIQAR